MYKFLIPLFVLALLIGCTPQNNTASTTSDPAPLPSDDRAVSGSPAAMPRGEDALLTGKHVVTLSTTKGDIVLELDADKAPKAATNFVELSRLGYYNGLTFHRVIPDFMIQGGDPNGNGTGGESIFGPTFEDEPNDLKMVRGVIAMANRGPDTNGSQFFIMQGEEASWLQGKHTIFGRVTKGMDVVDAIVAVPTGPGNMPATPVTFTAEVE